MRDRVEGDARSNVRGMLERAIVKRIDLEAWKQSEATEKREQAQLERRSKNENRLGN